MLSSFRSMGQCMEKMIFRKTPLYGKNDAPKDGVISNVPKDADIYLY